MKRKKKTEKKRDRNLKDMTVIGEGRILNLSERKRERETHKHTYKERLDLEDLRLR